MNFNNFTGNSTNNTNPINNLFNNNSTNNSNTSNNLFNNITNQSTSNNNLFNNNTTSSNTTNPVNSIFNNNNTASSNTTNPVNNLFNNNTTSSNNNPINNLFNNNTASSITNTSNPVNNLFNNNTASSTTNTNNPVNNLFNNNTASSTTNTNNDLGKNFSFNPNTNNNSSNSTTTNNLFNSNTTKPTENKLNNSSNPTNTANQPLNILSLKPLPTTSTNNNINSNTNSNNSSSLPNQTIIDKINTLRQEINQQYRNKESSQNRNYYSALEGGDKILLNNLKLINNISSVKYNNIGYNKENIENNGIKEESKTILPINTLYRLMRNINIQHNVKNDYSIIPTIKTTSKTTLTNNAFDSNKNDNIKIDYDKIHENMNKMDPLFKKVYEDYINSRKQAIINKEKHSKQQYSQHSFENKIKYENHECQLFKKKIVESSDTQGQIYNMQKNSDEDIFHIEIEREINNKNNERNAFTTNGKSKYDNYSNYKTNQYSDNNYLENYNINNYNNKNNLNTYTPLNFNNKKVNINNINNNAFNDSKVNIYYNNNLDLLEQHNPDSLYHKINKLQDKKINENINSTEYKQNLFEEKFGFYFNNIKNYFYYSLTSQRLTESNSIGSDSLEIISQNKLIKDSLLNMIKDIQLSSNNNKNLVNKYYYINKDLSINESKIKLFYFLENLISNVSIDVHNTSTDKDINIYSIIVCSFKSLQNSFFFTVAKTNHKYAESLKKHYSNYSSNKNIITYLAIKETDKVRIVEEYSKIYIPNTHYYKSLSNDSSNKEINIEESKTYLNYWGTIYFLLKAGLDDQIEAYFHKNFNTDDEETQDFLNLINFNNTITKKHFYNKNKNISISSSLFEVTQQSYKRLKLKYEQLLNSTYNISSNIKNIYKIVCYSIALKIKQEFDQEFFDDMDEYMWYYLRIITNNDETSIYFDLENTSSSSQKLSLLTFQDFIKESGLENNVDNVFDMLKYYFMIGMFKEGISKASSYTNNISEFSSNSNDLYLNADFLNIMYISYECGFFSNFSDVNICIKKSIKNSFVSDTDNYSFYFNYFFNLMVEQVYNNNLNSNKYNNKEEGNYINKALILYLISNSKILSLAEQSNTTYLTDKGYLKTRVYDEKEKKDLINTFKLNPMVQIDKLFSAYPCYFKRDLFIQLVEKLKLYSILNLNSIYSLLDDNYISVSLVNIIGKSDQLKSIIKELLKSAIKYKNTYMGNDSMFTSNSLQNNYNNYLLLLAKEYDFIEELIQLLINNFIFILKEKTPKIIFNSKIHLVSNISNKTNLNEELKSLQNDFSQFFDYLSLKLNNTNNQVYKNTYQWIVQLKSIEIIYDMINNNLYDEALNYFHKYISVFPYNRSSNSYQAYCSELKSLNEELVKFVPDIICLYVFLISNKLIYIKQHTIIGEW